MKTLEYRTVNKATWGSGPWQDEPDKVQWRDDVTGLPCLIVRGPGGALCGYVGIKAGHPFFGREYSDRVKVDRENFQLPEQGSPIELFLEIFHENDGCVSASMCFSIHGGLTFSGHCAEITRERWEKWRERMLDPERHERAKEFPHGDDAAEIREKWPLVNDFEAWKAYMESAAICHCVEEGEDDNVWWLGFDCAHAGDLSPKYERLLNDIVEGPRYFRDDTYRDIEYVKEQVRNLALQLHTFALEHKTALFIDTGDVPALEE